MESKSADFVFEIDEFGFAAVIEEESGFVEGKALALEVGNGSVAEVGADSDVTHFAGAFLLHKLKSFSGEGGFVAVLDGEGHRADRRLQRALRLRSLLQGQLR